MRFDSKSKAARKAWSVNAHKAKARKRMEGPPLDEPRRVPAGQLLGVLQWHDLAGEVHRWRILQGPRANNIEVRAKGKAVVCGWDHLLRKLRKRLAVPKRIFAL